MTTFYFVPIGKLKPNGGGVEKLSIHSKNQLEGFIVWFRNARHITKENSVVLCGTIEGARRSARKIAKECGECEIHEIFALDGENLLPWLLLKLTEKRGEAIVDHDIEHVVCCCPMSIIEYIAAGLGESTMHLQDGDIILEIVGESGAVKKIAVRAIEDQHPDNGNGGAA